MRSKNQIEKRQAGAALALTFAMLWVPIGQHEFLLKHWMKLGTFMAPFLLFIAIVFRSNRNDASKPDIRFVSLLLLVAYIAHQFEEHWVDLFGNVYAFKPYVNSLLFSRLGVTESDAPPLSDAGVFIINTSLVWLVAILAIWRGPTHVFPTLCMTSIVLINAISHLLTALLATAYNPGLLTAGVLFLPLGIAVYSLLLRMRIATWQEVWWSVSWGVLAHIFMITGMLATGWFKFIPEYAYFALLVAWSILPSMQFHRGGSAVE